MFSCFLLFCFSVIVGGGVGVGVVAVVVVVIVVVGVVIVIVVLVLVLVIVIVCCPCSCYCWRRAERTICATLLRVLLFFVVVIGAHAHPSDAGDAA